MQAEGIEYRHPLFQSQFVFFSEVGVFIIYYTFLRKSHGYDPSDPRPKMPYYMALCSVSLNVIGSPLFYVGLSMVAGSVFQMMNGFQVVATAVLSMIFLKKKYYRHHWTAILFIVGGIALVGYGGTRHKVGTSSTSFLGIMITLLAMAVYGGVYVIDEAIF